MSRFYFTLVSMAEPKYRDFSAALLPGVDNLLGVRLPALRKMAAKIAREADWRDFYPNREIPLRKPRFVAWCLVALKRR